MQNATAKRYRKSMGFILASCAAAAIASAAPANAADSTNTKNPTVESISQDSTNGGDVEANINREFKVANFTGVDLKVVKFSALMQPNDKSLWLKAPTVGESIPMAGTANWTIITPAFSANQAHVELSGYDPYAKKEVRFTVTLSPGTFWSTTECTSISDRATYTCTTDREVGGRDIALITIPGSNAKE